MMCNDCHHTICPMNDHTKFSSLVRAGSSAQTCMDTRAFFRGSERICDSRSTSSRLKIENTLRNNCTHSRRSGFTLGFIRNRFRIKLFVHRFAETQWARLYGSRSDLFSCFYCSSSWISFSASPYFCMVTYLVPPLSDKPSHNPANVKNIAKLYIELDTNIFGN